MPQRKRKLYAYVDESGQDTKGAVFLVAVVIVGEMRDALRRKLQEIERASRKQAQKWTKARHAQRASYMEHIISSREFAGHVYYSRYQDTRAYVDLIILSTAKALLAQGDAPLQATIMVDGLGRSERHRFAAGLRKLKIAVNKVRGARDQSDEFIRLADAVAGFVRDGLEGDRIMQPLFERAKRRGIIKEV